MASGDDRSVDLTHDIFATTKYVARLPAERPFLPWHRPRKHFVRRDQWTQQILDLYQGRPVDHPLRYLGLPGDDLLDLRYFHARVCAPTGRQMRFLGFSRSAASAEPEQLDLNVSRDEVARLSGLDPQSVILGDDFRLLSSDKSIAWKAATELGPFDVVNIDLCDGLASEPPHEKSMYEAINRLVSFQSRSQYPWLLLVTSRIGPEHVDAGVLSLLVGVIKANLEKCPPFADALESELDVADFDDELDSLDAQGFFSSSVVALCKWILELVHAAAPSRVEVKSCISYRVSSSAGCDDLVSVALRVDPIIGPVPDPARLASSSNLENDEDCKQAARIPRRVAKTVRADLLLLEKAELLEELTSEMEDLLVAARYDRSAYREWLRDADS